MENNDIVNTALRIVFAQFSGAPKSHEELVKFLKNLTKIKSYEKLTKQQIDEIAFQYEKEYGSKTFVPGITLSEVIGNESWFYKKKTQMSDNDHPFEKRYKSFLQKKYFGEKSINYIIGEAENILSYCSDPDSTEKKRGLVMGDVQSGKTSNYLALANLACDYGYKIILILAGMTDSLRIQTQERVDEGIIGAVSSTIGADIRYIGVGTSGHAHYAIPFTTDVKDFESANCTSADLNKPQILVVKKNKSILTSVKKWLKPGCNNISSSNILIIDDECDNASVNTKKDQDPSTINALIRDIYNNFKCSTYVGYTATPFANIFINPDDNPDYEDLFPKDFIHRLISSDESYFGAKKTFDSEKKHIFILNEEENHFIPAKHKKDYDVICLPDSLKNAICNFLICNCIRTLRGNEIEHRTMMINVSPYNAVQGKVHYLVESYVEHLKNVIWQYDKYDLGRFLKNNELKRIYDIYSNSKLFSIDSNGNEAINKKIKFDDIKSLLHKEISKFIVTIINNKYKGDQRFKYKDYKDVGARLIAIGGFVLSRGLTLEGLMTSYYSRNSLAYDTLLQMCRWFGYRPNYEDLCSIYMSQIHFDSFGAVVDAVNNLDNQLEVMKVQGQSPKDFGLMIKESPETLETKLLISARNKLKHSKTIIKGLNYSGVDVDTSKLYADQKHNSHNLAAVKDLYRTLYASGYSIEKANNGTRNMFRNIPNNFIADFIKSIDIPLENKKFNTEFISKFIRKGDYYKKWDIVFATGDNKKDDMYKLGSDLAIYPVRRSFEKNDDENIIRIAKNNNRLLDPGIFNSGLTNSEIEIAKAIAVRNRPTDKRVKLIARDYLGVKGRNPLLVILPIKLTQDQPPSSDSSDYKQSKVAIINQFSNNNDYLIGFGIGFAGNEGKVMMNFRINVVKEKEYLSKYEDEEEFLDE